MKNHPLKIFTGRTTRYLTEKICDSLDVDLGHSSCPVFADGEFEPCYEETIRGSHVFIVQSTPPTADNLLELLLMVDAAKRASAYKVIAVVPYFGYARQDRKDKPRVSIGAKLVADLLSTAGIDRLITMDLHADQIQGFFNVPVVITSYSIHYTKLYESCESTATSSFENCSQIFFTTVVFPDPVPPAIPMISMVL